LVAVLGNLSRTELPSSQHPYSDQLVSELERVGPRHVLEDNPQQVEPNSTNPARGEEETGHPRKLLCNLSLKSSCNPLGSFLCQSSIPTNCHHFLLEILIVIESVEHHRDY
jgi:hypothetical protein